ncbi:unnamed protein product [Xylocopa violacea]|uniref:Replication factor C subunit 1 n=1 Tax=Xylocopa violacea TaxID=135666 RepID=A0ABP1N3W9_XYLVO
MSRDIRSYFQSMKTSTAKTSLNTAPTRSKRRIISSDEDDERIQSPIKRSKKSLTLKNKSFESDSDSEEDAKKKKVVSPAAMFGRTPITRQEAPKIFKKEVKIHNDEDFEVILCQLDTSDIEQKYVTETIICEVPELHKNNDNNEEKKKKPVKNKQNIKEKKVPDKINVEKTDKKDLPNDKEHSNSSSSEDIEHHGAKQSSKSKCVTRRSKTSKSISKMEIEHKEKNEVSPKKTEASDIYEERIEKRKQSAAMYQQYLQRGGARNPGSKEIPVGDENCLAGLSFVITGVLDSLEREEADELIKRYGGRILHQVSKKTDYVIIGDQPGPAKVAKAKSLNIKEISEDDLLELIRTRHASQSDVKQSRTKSKNRFKQKSTDSEEISPPKRAKLITNEETEKKEPSDEQTEKSPRKSPWKKKRSNKEVEKSSKTLSQKEEPSNKETEKLLQASPNKKEVDNTNVMQRVKKQLDEDKELDLYCKKEINDAENIKVQTNTLPDINGNIPTQALVEKYRPKSMKQILGQQGDKSNVKKLYTWLMNWHKNHGGQQNQAKRIKPSPWAKNDDGSFFKAALLSGPPGIGKTTTVQVVCNELCLDLVEFNASDTRSKKLLQEEVSKFLSNTTLKNYFQDTNSKPSMKQVLLMDEVDGMAGNEDRGGLQELIALIKSTDIPIVCICNDRNNPKMRTLANYTFDLRFTKPKLTQIRGAMKSICFKENIDISNEDLDRLIESTNQDIRQVINHLALFVGRMGSQDKSEKKHVNKDLKLGPWDVVRQVFSAEEHKHMNIHDKSELFFHDYNIGPLFVQENYLRVVPQAPRKELLKRIAKCAESIALGDIVEKSIRSNNAWSLLPVQSCFSSVIPGTAMSGHIDGQITFPEWLGRNSKAGKVNRLLQDVTVHARLATGASKEAINLDYIKPLRDAIIRHLTIGDAENVDAAVDIMNHYHLLREDLDSIIEISTWSDQRPLPAIDSKVKAAFTRAYNKNSKAVPYTISSISKMKATSNLQDEGLLDEEEATNSDENDDNVEIDKMIKAKKPSASKKAEAKGKGSNDKPSKRGRGRGKQK